MPQKLSFTCSVAVGRRSRSPIPSMSDVRGMLKSAAAYESLGIAALEGGDLATATSYFRQGLDVAPDSASLHHRLGTALFLGGDARAGQEQFEAALKLAPDFARAHYSLGVVMASAGRPREAIEAAVRSGEVGAGLYRGTAAPRRHAAP